MKGGLLIVLALACASLLAVHQIATETYSEFEEWKQTFKMNFETGSEEFYRRTIFYHNLARIAKHNSNSGETYKMGVNQFTAYTEEQFSQRFLGLGQGTVSSSIRSEDKVKAVIVDWVEKGAVTAVKNQGMCGGGVLYATLGGVEGLGKVATGTLQAFSEQQLIDCVFGCAGSQAAEGYNYYKSHSVCTAAEYPYTGRAGTCQAKTCSFKISGYKTANNCNDLASAITKQPVSVTVDASKWATYASGIFSNCGTALNHMVLLVGLADEYWKGKNSWGTSWGERGFIRLARGDTCGICQYGIFPQH